MNVTIEITNDCDSQWVPDQETCENWIQTALDLLGENKQYNVSLCLVDEAGSKDLNSRYCVNRMPQMYCLSTLSCHRYSATN